VENELRGGDGPNGVFGVRRVRGEVTKGLAVVQPRLLGFFGGVGVIDGGVTVRLVQEFVSGFAEVFPRLGVDEFLEFGFEEFLGGVFIVII